MTLTGETTELLQALIRNECVNDGTPESGQEVRNTDLLKTYLEGAGLDIETYEPTPGRTSLVARIEGSDPDAPTVCLCGHTDVVPVTPDGWSEDPFGGELKGDEVWGRGAVDMLNLTSSMAVAFKAPRHRRQLQTSRLAHLLRRSRRGGGRMARCPLGCRQQVGRSRVRLSPHRDGWHSHRYGQRHDALALGRREGAGLAAASCWRHTRPWIDALRIRQRRGHGV